MNFLIRVDEKHPFYLHIWDKIYKELNLIDVDHIRRNRLILRYENKRISRRVPNGRIKIIKINDNSENM